MKYTSYFSDKFKELITKKYAGIKKSAKNKIDIIINKPFFGESLKGDLDGLRSAPVKGNFIIIYIICKECREKEKDKLLNCSICSETLDESIIFIYLAPHDDAYKIAKKLVNKGKIFN